MDPPYQCKYVLLFPPGGIRLTEKKCFSIVWLNSGHKRKRVRYTEMAKLHILLINLETHTFYGTQKGCLQWVVFALNAFVYMQRYHVSMEKLLCAKR